MKAAEARHSCVETEKDTRLFRLLETALLLAQKVRRK